MPYFFISSLAKTLLPSIMAARALGPKVEIPAWRSASAQPSTRGSSGATTAKPMSWLTAKDTMPSMSVAAMSTHSLSALIPAFPGRA